MITSNVEITNVQLVMQFPVQGKLKWVLLNRTPTCTQLHPPPPSSFQPPPSSLQHPQQYLNQNIARNWAISPNLGQKLKVVYFD